MGSFDILDEEQSGENSIAQAERERKRAHLLPWVWMALICFVFFLALPSFIMWNYSPSDVNEVSPIEAHLLVIGMFVISGLGLLALIGLLIWRWDLGRKRWR